MSNGSQTRTRLPPVSATTRELYLYSGNQCAFPGCTRALLRRNGTWNCQVAHIYGVKPASARGDHTLTEDQLRHPSNLLLMCPNHHNEIDNKALDDEFTVAVVQRMKADHEARYREAMAGLERIVDTSESITVTYPTNLGAFDFDETMFEESIDDTRRFIDAIAKQPLGMRDLMVLILVHGRQHPGLTAQPYPVAVPVTQIEGVVQIDANEIWRRSRHLEEAGLLELIDNEGFPYFALAVPGGVGWDIFVDLMGLAKGDRAIIERAVLDLDFSVFDR